VPQLNNVDTAFAYLGRSLFGTHPWLNATIDEFRIYDGRLSAEDILANFIAGPDELALPIRVEYSNTISGWELRWPDYAAGFTLDSAQTPGGIWQPVPGKSALTGAYNVFPAIQPTSNQVFRLKR